MRSLPILITAVATAHAQAQFPSISIPPEGFPPLPTLFKRADFSEPCEEVSASWAAQKAEATSDTQYIRVPAQVAYECLQSVPVDQEGDVKEIEELKQLAQFQTTLSYLKDGTFYKNGTNVGKEAVDVLGTLDEISQGVQNGSYSSDYEVQLAIWNVFQKTGDFHFTWNADIFELFTFIRNGGNVISLSTDGLELPKIYYYGDLAALKTANFTPSPIKTINGKNATEYLFNASSLSSPSFHDADARYNALFPNLASQSYGSDSLGSFAGGFYDGPTTEFAFENGTVKSFDNLAAIPPSFDFTDVTDGNSFFSKFCQGPPNEPEATPTPTPTPTPTGTFSNSTNVTVTLTPTAVPTPIGYPAPVIVHDSLYFQGYFLNGTGYEDTAVLAIPNFQPPGTPTDELDEGEAGIVEVQEVLRTFFSEAVKEGKQKLVIDLRANTGGTIDMGFEVFRQLFPEEEPYGATRYRANEAFEIISAEIADVAENATAQEYLDPVTYAGTVGSVFNYQNILNVDREHFDSFREYYGPYTVNNDTFTDLRRYNFSNHMGGHTTSVNLTGYNGVPAAPQPFKSQNIVLLQDGFCGSTCAIFAELMREQGKVQSIAVGGRPQNAPMQGVGGSKGANVFGFDFVVRAAKVAFNLTAVDGGEAAAKMMANTAVGKIAATEQLYNRTSHLSKESILTGGVNSLDNFRMNDTNETPLEYIYEAADCRLFYSVETVVSPVPLWEMVVDAKWGNGKCVDGSTGDVTSLSGVEGKSFNQKNSSSPGEWTGAASGLQASTMMIGVALLSALALVM